MELMTLFLTIMTCLVCGALAAAFFGSRPTTFEQAVAAELASSSDKMRTSDSKKKKTRKHPTTKKTVSKKSGLEESDEDDSMPDEDAVAGLLHARGINLKTTETTSNNHSPRAATKGLSRVENTPRTRTDW